MVPHTLVDFPIPKLKSNTETQQWLEILAEIYTYLCATDERIRSALVETGPRPFTLECRSPWGRDMQHPDTAPQCCLISDVLVNVRVAIASDTLTACRWMGTKGVAVYTPPSESFRTKLSTSGNITRPMFWNPYLFFVWADYLDILQYLTTIY